MRREAGGGDESCNRYTYSLLRGYAWRGIFTGHRQWRGRDARRYVIGDTWRDLLRQLGFR